MMVATNSNSSPPLRERGLLADVDKKMENKICICGEKVKWWQKKVGVNYSEYCHIPNGCCGTIAVYMHKKCYEIWRTKNDKRP